MGNNKKIIRFYRIYFSIAFGEGLFVLFLFFLQPSSSGNVWLWGFTKPRILIGALLLTLVLFWGLLLIISVVKKNWVDKSDAFLSSKIGNKKLFIFVLLFIVYFLLLFLFFIIISPYSKLEQFQFSSLVQIQRLLPSAIWLILLITQSMMFIKTRFGEQWKKIKGEIKVLEWAIVLLVVLFTSYLWIALIIQFDFKVIHFDWFFLYQLKNINFRYFYFGILIIFSWYLIKFIYKSPQKSFIKVIVLILFGYILQVSYGFIDGRGFGFFQYYYAESFISLPVDIACLNLSLTEIIKDYEKLFSSGFWTQTKPPGFALIFAGFGKLASLLNPRGFLENCRTGFISVGSYLMPLISLLLIIPLTELSKKILLTKDKFLPALIYIFTPSVLLMTQVPDQVFFPLFFTISIYLIFLVLEKRQFWMAFVLGIALYLNVFFSFSLLPVLGLFGIWFFIRLIMNIKKWQRIEISKVMIGSASGLIGAHYYFVYVFNYNVFSRYFLAMESHRGIKNYSINLKKILDVLLLNNVEFAIWTGIPIIILFIVTLIRLIFRGLGKMDHRRFQFIIAFLGSFLVLNIAGQTIAEVGRLWLFLVPGFILIVAPETLKLIPGNEKLSIFLIVTLQLLTSIFLYRYFFFYSL